MENNQVQNPREIHLSAICLKPAFDSTANDLLLGKDESVVKSNIRILWKKAVQVIPIVHGQNGEIAIHLIRMMAYLDDFEFNIVVLGNSWWRISIADPQKPRIFDLLALYGLLNKSNDWKFYPTANGENRISGKIRLHSSILLEVIREGNHSLDEGRQKQLVKECVQTFDLEDIPKHYKAIWTPIINSNWDDIILEFHKIGTFYERYFYDDNIDPTDKELFDKTLLKYAELYGPYHEMTMKLRALEVSAIFISQDFKHEEKWNAWSEKVKPYLDVFLQIPTVETFMGKWRKMFYIFQSIICHLLKDEFTQFRILDGGGLNESVRLHDILSLLRNTTRLHLCAQFRLEMMHLLKSKSNPEVGQNMLQLIQHQHLQGQTTSGPLFLNLRRSNLGSWICLIGRILDTIENLSLDGIKDQILMAVRNLLKRTTYIYSGQISRNSEWDTQCFLPGLDLITVRYLKASGEHEKALDYATTTRSRRVDMLENCITSERERIREIYNKIDEIVHQNRFQLNLPPMQGSFVVGLGRIRRNRNPNV